MNDIDRLRWDLPEWQQRENMAGISLSTSQDISQLILPYQKKECWENCAVLLSGLDDNTLLPFLPRILEWYKDLNWPGFRIISERLDRFGGDAKRDAVIAAMQRAEDEKDEEWY